MDPLRAGPAALLSSLVLLVMLVLAFGAPLAWAEDRSNATDDGSYAAGQARLERALAYTPRTGPAKNVIVFVGDGMDVTTVTAARIHAGQENGQSGEENLLSWERFPHVGLAKTYNSNQQVPDSAGTATALFAGAKTKAGVIGVGPEALRGDCASSNDQHLKSVFELAQAAGRATGVVTTTRLTHATPAAAYAHSPERGWEVDRAIPEDEAALGCIDIAVQLLDFADAKGLEVALGGGRLAFLPADDGGQRGDGRDLTYEWSQKSPGHVYVENKSQLAEIDREASTHVLGLFAISHMSFDADRSGTDEPSLADMTRAAIRLLQRNPEGFVLQVEGGRIDHAHHATNAHRALDDTIAMSDAVEAALELVDPNDTLIVVTADHGHTMTMSGYPRRGNLILDVVRPNDASGLPREEPFLAGDGKPYTTLAYANGPGAVVEKGNGNGEEEENGGGVGRPFPEETESIDYRQQALVPLVFRFPNGATLEAETHGGQDVPIWATGPGAHLFQGTVEQSYVFHVLRHALRLEAP